MNNTPIILILDAGGTGFKFSAVQDAHEIIEPFTIPSAAPTLEEVLQKCLRPGYTTIKTFSIHSGLKYGTARNYLTGLCKGDNPCLRRVKEGNTVLFKAIRKKEET